MALQSLHYDANGQFEVLDQLLLPNEIKYVTIKNCVDGWNVIERMQVLVIHFSMSTTPLFLSWAVLAAVVHDCA